MYLGSELFYIVADLNVTTTSEDKPLDSSQDLWELLGGSRKEGEDLYPRDPEQRGVESNQKTFSSYLYWHKLSTARAWHHNCAGQQRRWTHAPGERTEPYKVKDHIPRDRTNSRLPAETQQNNTTPPGGNKVTVMWQLQCTDLVVWSSLPVNSHNCRKHKAAVRALSGWRLFFHVTDGAG